MGNIPSDISQGSDSDSVSICWLMQSSAANSWQLSSTDTWITRSSQQWIA